MEPKLVWVEGRCYRFVESDVWSSKDLASTTYTEEMDPLKFSELNEETCTTDIDITSLEGGKYEHSFYVPNVFFKFLIGANGTMRKKLENETRTSISIPKQGKDGDIVITATKREAIVSARHRIDLLVETSRKKLRPTHFLSIPMKNETIASNYEKFKNIALHETGKDCRGVHEGIFQKPVKMHLTLGVLILVDDEEVKAAVEALNECKEVIKPIIDKNGPINIKLQGVDCFDDEKSKNSHRVIFGKVSSENDALQEVAEKVEEFFLEKGMLKKDRDEINLHLTLMNASFMIDKNSPGRMPYVKFDGTKILEAHKDYFFGEIALSEIELCVLDSPSENSYYPIVSKIQLD